MSKQKIRLWSAASAVALGLALAIGQVISGVPVQPTYAGDDYGGTVTTPPTTTPPTTTPPTTSPTTSPTKTETETETETPTKTPNGNNGWGNGGNDGTNKGSDNGGGVSQGGPGVGIPQSKSKKDDAADDGR